jgi:hypothetical protein
MKWRVVLHCLVRRTYEVEGDDEKEAVQMAWRSLPIEETDIREDVITVVEEVMQQQ